MLEDKKGLWFKVLGEKNANEYGISSGGGGERHHGDGMICLVLENGSLWNVADRVKILLGKWFKRKT